MAQCVAVRPEGIRKGTDDGGPALLLREVEGNGGITLPLDEVEAHLLAGEFQGVRNRHSRAYETLEKLIAGMGGAVTALRLMGDRERGLSGEIEVAADRRRVRVPAHPGDVAALAWRPTSPCSSPPMWSPRGQAFRCRWPPRPRQQGRPRSPSSPG